VPTKEGMVTVARLDEDFYVRLFKNGRDDQTKSSVICEFLDMADKLEKEKKRCYKPYPN
jgi:hypothetical protein